MSECYYCRCATVNHAPANGILLPNAKTREHKNPQSRYGYYKNMLSNVVTACYRCNNIKGNMSEDQFQKLATMHGYDGDGLRLAASKWQSERDKAFYAKYGENYERAWHKHPEFDHPVEGAPS